MRCGWCGSRATAEYVDVGVGSVQVDAARCDACGALQMSWPYDNDNATLEERRRGWWMGEDTEDFMVHDLDDDSWHTGPEWLARVMGTPAELPEAHSTGARPHVLDFHSVAHASIVQVTWWDDAIKLRFETRCSRSLALCAGIASAPTCIDCIIRS